MFDLITIGGATIDNYIQIHDAEVKCNLNKTECFLCIRYGDKIAVDKFIHTVGGGAANYAIGGAKLKLKVATYINIGSDPAGKQIKDKLKQEGISTRYIVENVGMESNLSTVLIFQGERTIFVYQQDWEYKLPDLDSSKWVSLTSVSKTIRNSNLCNELSAYIERTGTKLLYNPGPYQIQDGIKRYPKLLSLTELFIVNVEEAKRILGHKDEEDIPVRKLLKLIADLGPKLVVITNGLKGSYAFDNHNYYHLEVFPAKLLEMTGAGDAYASGILAGLLHGEELKEAMRWGAANSASVVEQIGPQAGLLTYSQMQEKLKQNSKILAKEI